MGSREWWESGARVDPRTAGFAPIAALLAVTLAIAFSGDGDIRDGIFPWAMAFAAVCLAMCALGVVAVHRGHSNRWVLVGGWWTTFAMAGVAGAFFAIGVGALLGITEDEAGALSVLPFVAMAFAILSMTPALASLGVGVTRAHVLPRWGVAAVWIAAPLVPTLMIFGGLTEGTVETLGTNGLLGLFAFAWLALGASLRVAGQAAVPERPPEPLS